MTDARAGLTVSALTVRYPGRKEAALKEISLEARAGEIVAVAGRNGAGKSTLALAVGGFIPRVLRARVEGSVDSSGVDVLQATLREIAGRIGIIFSTPALQLSASKPSVREELAFGLENLGVPRAEMDARINDALSQLGVGHLAEREPLALSGGEQQRVAIASVLVMGTQLLVLDEPVAQLDPAASNSLAALLGGLSADGRTVVVAEHEPAILSQAKRCVLLDHGEAIATEAPGSVLGGDVLEPLGLTPPTLVTLAEAAGLSAAQRFDEVAIARSLGARQPRTPVTAARSVNDWPRVERLRAPEIRVEGLVHRYGSDIEAVQRVSLSVSPGSSVAIIGQNGSGKTTLIKHLNGLLRPTSGRVLVDGADIKGNLVSDMASTVGFVFQSPDDQLFHGSVEQEVAFGPRNLGLTGASLDERVSEALALVGLDHERGTNPYDLGLSARKLIALASVLAMRPPVLVLDEPTTGQDGPGRELVGRIVDAWTRAERTVVAISHDMEFVAQHFGRVVVMREGQIILDGEPRQVFGPANAELLGSTGLVPPPTARIAARLGLADVPLDVLELIELLAARHQPAS